MSEHRVKLLKEVDQIISISVPRPHKYSALTQHRNSVQSSMTSKCVGTDVRSHMLNEIKVSDEKKPMMLSCISNIKKVSSTWILKPSCKRGFIALYLCSFMVEDRNPLKSANRPSKNYQNQEVYTSNAIKQITNRLDWLSLYEKEVMDCNVNVMMVCRFITYQLFLYFFSFLNKTTLKLTRLFRKTVYMNKRNLQR